MTMSMMFWILMLLWLVLGTVGPGGLRAEGKLTLSGASGSLLMFIIVALLGYASFGPPIQ